ncbi:MAG TPA: DUF1800 domain-containing protein [Planctomycetota bacterium]
MPHPTLPSRTPSRLEALLPRGRPPRPDLRRRLDALGGPPPAPVRRPLALLGRLAGTGLGAPAAPARAPHRDPLLTLVHRITQGFERTEYERARALGYDAYLEEQLAPESIDDSAMDARLAGYTTLALSPKQLYEAYFADPGEPYFQFKGAALLRAVHSRRQLQERMVEFWWDHFCIDHNKGDIEFLFMADHDRLKVRPHALGSFPELLSAVAHSNAMLFYLDNWLNVAGGIQENYSRELLELHSLGVHGGYSEVDVKEVAKCFTGWTLNQDFASPNWFRQRFEASAHVAGDKLVLGQVIPALPPRDNAQAVIDIVAAHPSTAAFLARKLIRWLLTPTPPQALVDQVASTYLATNGDVKALLRVILARENMRWASPLGAPRVAPRLRRPFHFVVSLLRTLGADVADPIYPLFYLYTLGHVPFDHVQPDGYPDTTAAWGSALLPRWRFASDLLAPAAVFGEPFPGVHVAHDAVRDKLGFAGPADRPGLAGRMNEHLFGSTLAELEVGVLQDYIDAQPTFGGVQLYESIALGASLPGFQWY